MTTVQTPTVQATPKQNLYRVLNVRQTASADELKKAINREQRLWSNRTNAPQIERRQEAERMVKLLEQAEAILLDTAKRAAYDRQLSSTPPAGSSGVIEGELADIADLVKEAQDLLDSGRTADALFVADKATQKEGGNPEAWAVLAKAQHQWGETDDALSSYRRAIKLRPNDSTYYFELGCIYESLERQGEALQQWQRAVQIDPAVSMYRAGVGFLLAKQGNYHEGIATLEQCRQEQPDNPTYQWYLAIAYMASCTEGWTHVPAGHPILSEDWYATEYKHVTDAQAALANAEALKFDDDELMGQIKHAHRQIDRMLNRRFTCNWFIAGVVGFIGLFLVFIPTLVAIAYVISSMTPQYKIFKRQVQGKQFNEFAFLGPIIQFGLPGIVITYAIIFFLMPFVAVINFIRNWAIK